MPPRPVTLSLGGSILAPADMTADGVRRIAATLDDRCEMPLGLVTGGGAAARDYIHVARELGLDEAGLDWLGVNLTRANAWLLIAAFGEKAYPRPAESFEEAALALRSYDRVCMGGTHPGHTTDAVAALLAERIRAQRLVIVTNVEGVYSSDPSQDRDAKLLEEVTAAQLVDIVGGARQAGAKVVVDPLAAQVVLRSNLEAAVVSGADPDNVAKAVRGQAFKGTRVTGS